MNPIVTQPGTREDLPRWGRREMDDLTVEVLARWPQKCD